MAETPLPSREAMHSPESWVERTPKGVALALIGRAYASGRLVDREAINYEAARKVLQPANESDRPYWTVFARAVVDAALMGTLMAETPLPSREELTIIRLVKAVTLLLGENPKHDGMRQALFNAAEAADFLDDRET